MRVVARRPVGHIQADGSFVCPHRDVTCCPACATHPHIVEVMGAHFYIRNAAERAALTERVESDKRDLRETK